MGLAPAADSPRAHAPSLLSRVGAVWGRRETILMLTSASLSSAHRHKVLGHLWNLLDPLLFMLVYFFVFGVLFGLVGQGGGRSSAFMLYILSGLITYRFVSSVISECASCVRANRGLIHEISFPKAVFPIAVALARAYDYVWGLVVLAAFLLLSGQTPTASVLALPLVAGLMFAFALGVGFVTAYVGAFYADTSNVVQVAMRLLFYCSPVFYFVRDAGEFKAMFAGGALRTIYMLNPLAGFMECSRDALLWGRFPQWDLLAYSGVVAIAACVAGFCIYSSGEGKFAKYV